MEGGVFLSVVVPTYNRRGALEETAESVLGQDGFGDGVELLISDNCSTDGTEELVRRRFLGAGRRVTYVRRPENVGPDANFRLAIAGASGRYVKLLNDTRPMLPGALRLILETLERERPSVLLTSNGARYLEDYRVTDSVDDFVLAASYNATWLGGICLDKGLWDSVPDKERGNGLFLIQTCFLFDVLAQRPRAVVDNRELFRSLPSPGPVGGYNLFRVFVENYLGILSGLVSDGRLGRRAYMVERRRLLYRFMVPSIVRLIEKPERFRYESEGWARIAFAEYRSDPLLYLSPLIVLAKLASRKAKALLSRREEADPEAE